MEALWFELKPFGIAVSLIEPGFIRTAINQATRFAAEPLAAYDGPRDRALAVIDRSVEEGIGPEVVAKVVLRAAQKRNPQLRYRVGAGARWLPRLKAATPWNFFASGVRRTFDLDSIGLPARPAPFTHFKRGSDSNSPFRSSPFAPDRALSLTRFKAACWFRFCAAEPENFE